MITPETIEQEIKINSCLFFELDYTSTFLILTKCQKEIAGELVIPSSSTINGKKYPVKIIGQSAFEGCIGLTSVIIPNGVETIENSAFHSCSSLVFVTIPNSVMKIQQAAFKSCKSLASIAVPHTVTTLCSDILVDTAWYRNQPDGLVYLNDWCLGYKGYKPIGDISIKPETVGIADNSFRRCSEITTIVIPDSVTKIGNNAFSGCTGLTSVTIGNSVKEIGFNAFYGCTGLISVIIPDSVTSIGREAFCGCSSLVSVTMSELNNIGYYAENLFRFKGCSSLTSVVFTRFNGYYNAFERDFENCNNLKRIIIPCKKEAFVHIKQKFPRIPFRNLLEPLDVDKVE